VRVIHKQRLLFVWELVVRSYENGFSGIWHLVFRGLWICHAPGDLIKEEVKSKEP